MLLDFPSFLFLVLTKRSATSGDKNDINFLGAVGHRLRFGRGLCVLFLFLGNTQV